MKIINFSKPQYLINLKKDYSANGKKIYSINVLYEFEETQKIYLKSIICDICKKNNKGNSYNKEFYICNTCNKDICLLCKSVHDQNHKIINYDDKNYICRKHNEPFHKYCKTCNENICFICETKHNSHDIFDLRNILIDEEDVLKTLNNLKIKLMK